LKVLPHSSHVLDRGATTVAGAWAHSSVVTGDSMISITATINAADE